MKKLETKKELWAQELNNVLWAYRTTPRSSIGESPFSLFHGAKVVLSTKLNYSSTRFYIVADSNHAEVLVLEANLLEGKKKWIVSI